MKFLLINSNGKAYHPSKLFKLYQEFIVMNTRIVQAINGFQFDEVSGEHLDIIANICGLVRYNGEEDATFKNRIQWQSLRLQS